MSRSAELERAGEGIGYQSRALTRGLAILGAFDDAHPVLTPAQLQTILRIPRPTIVRLARILDQHGFLRRTNGSYRLGPRGLELGQTYLRGMHLPDVVEPIVADVSAQLRQTCCLASLQGGEAVHLVVVRSTGPVGDATEVGQRAAAHASGLGKALLARLSEEEVTAAVGNGPYARLTARTLVDRAALDTELRRVRAHGHATDVEETVPGLRCVAVADELPLLGAVGLSVSGPAVDCEDEPAARAATTLREAFPRMAKALSRTLGERVA